MSQPFADRHRSGDRSRKTRAGSLDRYAVVLTTGVKDLAGKPLLPLSRSSTIGVGPLAAGSGPVLRVVHAKASGANATITLTPCAYVAARRRRR